MGTQNSSFSSNASLFSFLLVVLFVIITFIYIESIHYTSIHAPSTSFSPKSSPLPSTHSGMSFSTASSSVSKPPSSPQCLFSAFRVLHAVIICTCSACTHLHRILPLHPPVALPPQAIHRALTQRNADTHPPLAPTPTRPSGMVYGVHHLPIILYSPPPSCT
jgi:hypothetical protein